MPAGHPKEPKYSPDMPERAYVLCRDAGLTMPLLAKAFGVVRSTLQKWMVENPDLKDAIDRGREEFDTRIVEASCLKTAKGYTITETKTLLDGKGQDASMVIKTKKHIAPNVTAQIFWLKNRNPERWRDRVDVGVETSEEIKRTMTEARERLEAARREGKE